MIPEYFEFSCPVKVISGYKAISNLPYEMEQLGAKNALVVTDQGVVNAGLLKIVAASFKKSGAKIGAVYDRTPVDSSSQVCNEVAELFRKKKCDCLIALGGGSCLDTAKGANIVISEETDDLMKFQGTDRLTKPTRPLIAIPSTSGTGSEVTLVAVVRHTESEVKMPFMSERLYPNVAILDPKMTLTMPAKITAATGMDALTHAAEAFYCLQKNPISDAFALSAIRLISTHLVNATQNGSDEKARLGMANAALLAGIAFSNSMVGIVHAMAHATGSVAHIPHGVANAIFLPFGMEHNLKKVPEYLGQLAEPLGVTNLPAKPVDRAQAAIQAVRDLNRKLNELSGLPLTLSGAGVARGQLEAIAKATINDGSCTYNPEEVVYKEVLEILNRAF